MTGSVKAGILVVFVAAALVAVLVALFLLTNRPALTDAALTAEAVLVSPSGAAMGTVTFDQKGDEVLVAVAAHGLTPGGHSVAVHAVGSCTPDFAAAGDHFAAKSGRPGFVHRNWKRGQLHGDHGGDLPNIYAHADGSARADFVTDGFTLRAGQDHSIADADGAAIVIYERPQIYGATEGGVGMRIACGAIEFNWQR